MSPQKRSPSSSSLAVSHAQQPAKSGMSDEDLYMQYNAWSDHFSGQKQVHSTVGEQKKVPPIVSSSDRKQVHSTVNEQKRHETKLAPVESKSLHSVLSQQLAGDWNSFEINKAFALSLQDLEKNSLEAARLIVEDMHREEEEKCVQVLDVGGKAGGTKFSYKGIFLKMAEDPFFKSKKNPPGFYLYGGSAPSTGRASKAMRNECRGSGALLRFLLDNPRWLRHISVPVQLHIVYSGLTFVAMPFLPIGVASGKSELVYGSADGGRTIHNSDMLTSLFMRQFAASLHLAVHPVDPTSATPAGQARTVYLSTGGDVEGHLCLSASTAPRRILLDTARVLPPESNDMAMGAFMPRPHRPFDRGGIWFQSLREEFMRTLPGLLSSDLFSSWGKVNRSYFNQHGHAATLHLMTSSIQRLVQELVRRHRASVLPDLDSLVRFLWQKLGGVRSRLSKSMLGLVRHVLQQDILVYGNGAAKTLESLESQVLLPYFGLRLPESMRLRVYGAFKAWICSGTSLSALFHKFGVPLRHLGLVRAAVLETDWARRDQVAQWCRDEALARSVKQLLRSMLRGETAP